MFTSIRLRNFKSLKDTGSLFLAPMTLMCGPNSSGKSSLIQAFLTLKQTIESPSREDPLILNGSLVSLGEFDDIRYFSATERDQVVLEISLHFPSSRESIPINKLAGSRRSVQIPYYSYAANPNQLWTRRARRLRAGQVADDAYSMSISLALQKIIPTRHQRQLGGKFALNSTSIALKAEHGWFRDFEFEIEHDPNILHQLETAYEILGEEFSTASESLYRISRCYPKPSPSHEPHACFLSNFLPYLGWSIDHTRFSRMLNEFLIFLSEHSATIHANRIRWQQSILRNREHLQAEIISETENTVHGTDSSYQEVLNRLMKSLKGLVIHVPTGLVSSIRDLLEKGRIKEQEIEEWIERVMNFRDNERPDG